MFVGQRREKRGRGVCRTKAGEERTRCFVRQRREKRGRGVCTAKA